MKLSCALAKKLYKLQQGERLPASSLKNKLFEDLIFEKILRRDGRGRKTVVLTDPKGLEKHLFVHCGITNLLAYIQILEKEDAKRSDLVAVASNSKAQKKRTFKGFLINTYQPWEVMLDTRSYTLPVREGVFQFIYDFEKFTVPDELVIVGVENPENFRHIHAQKALFSHIKPLFVSRYPQNQSKDLITWLKSIPNEYLHFGDFDFAGLNIYIHEFKKHLGKRASFFMPPRLEKLLQEVGNRDLYNTQKLTFTAQEVKEAQVWELVSLLNKYQKGLEQEIYIN